MHVQPYDEANAVAVSNLYVRKYTDRFVLIPILMFTRPYILGHIVLVQGTLYILCTGTILPASKECDQQDQHE